jgi:hypothetical protein
MIRRLCIVVLTACAAAAGAAPAASADSLVFIRDNNVWLSNPDGSGQYQVTLDGTVGSPYESASQSNDGTILAIRQPPGGRNQFWRMTQSGRLLNPPINTPAPGPAGALDARIAPNGALVAYWFVTTVSDPYCPYCVNVSNRALLSYPDRFTNYDEVGTPNTGGWPSWVTNDTITIGSGSATQWYYKLGMPEAAQWFALSDLTGEILSLLDAEAAPTGDRIAVVRGDNQETILLAKMNGPPPAKPTFSGLACDVFEGPTGKFADPTWASDGRLLAWQEDDGIWVRSIPATLGDCAGYGTPALKIPGAKTPDLSPAAMNPGARPPCGHPGNPTACTDGSCPSCTNPNCPACQPGVDVRKKLDALLAAEAKALGRLGIRGLLRKKRTSIAYTADGPGTLALRLTGSRTAAASRATLLASGKHTFAAAGRARIVLKLTRKGKRVLRRAHAVRASLQATFTPATGSPTTVRKRVRLKR